MPLAAGTVAAHESAAVYLLPAPLRHYLQISQHPGQDPPQPSRRDSATGHGSRSGRRFRQGRARFHELHWVEVHSDERYSSRHRSIRSPSARVQVRDLGSEHSSCTTGSTRPPTASSSSSSSTGTRCRVVAELWSFENVKSFVREEVGLAIVPGITVRPRDRRRHARAGAHCPNS